jgi:diacylglycerol kinase (ATP)
MSQPEPMQTRGAEAIPSSALQPPVVILNPAGANGKALRLRKRIEARLSGGRGELVLTKARGDGERLAREAALAGRDVIAAGGDGTVLEVGSGVLASGRHVEMGIVPCGTGNDYAFETARLPHDPLAALEVALGGDRAQVVAMDAARMNDRYFLNSMGVGLDANIAAAAERMKRLPFMRGQVLYYTASLRELLFHYRDCPFLTVTLDGVEQPGQVYAAAALSIGPTYGGGFQINPGADPRDGLFSVCLIDKPRKSRALRLLPKVEKGEHINEPEVHRSLVTSVIFEARQTSYAQLDGEIVRAQRFEARILPGALLVRVPAKA